MIANQDQKEFEERSDYILKEDLLNWNVVNDHFAVIQSSLKASGIKLLVGPRGTGKTHQMKIFQEKCVADENMPMCIYISFTKYFYLEPYLSKNNNAIQIFHAWVLAKIVLACYELINDEKAFNIFLNQIGYKFNLNELIEFIVLAERGILEEEKSIVFKELSISSSIKMIENLLVELKRKRCVILFDDAALTLTQDYLVELFDIIRSIKTKSISPKASVYPGTTEYGPRFHVGHDAEEIICWLNIDDPSYSDFMDSFIDKRFSQWTSNIPSNILDIFKFASFGIPRALISLMRNYIKSKGTQQSRFNTAIKLQEEFIRTEYLSLGKRLPQLKQVILFGNIFFNNGISLLTKYNITKSSTRQLILGIDENSISEHRLFPRMLQFLNEAGLIYDNRTVSHGEDRSYRRFIMHILFLLKNRAFSGASRGFNASKILDKIKRPQEKHPLRKTIKQIIGQEEYDNLKLDFPPCSKCGFDRLTEEQLYCHNCGTELIRLSVFNECLRTPVDELSITQWQKDKMKSNGYNCIEDFISKKDTASALREIYQIGKVRAEKISSTVDKFISEYLS